MPDPNNPATVVPVLIIEAAKKSTLGRFLSVMSAIAVLAIGAVFWNKLDSIDDKIDVIRNRTR